MRIIAGEFRGRNLLPPPGPSITRPITSLVKKSLFDTLAPWLRDAVVLDLYCGTGTMGLEALSRGAAKCCFAELDRSVTARLRQNIEALGAATRSVVWQGDLSVRLVKWLGELPEAVDLAFVDPPYAHVRQWDWSAMVERVFTPLADKLAPEGLVALRLPSHTTAPAALGPLVVQREKRYGDMTVLLLGCEPAALAEPQPPQE